MKSAVQESLNATDKTPCSDEKPDICEFVRETMLSIKPAESGTDVPDKPLLHLPSIRCLSPGLSGSSSVALVSKVSFHPFQLPLSVSYRVLRI